MTTRSVFVQIIVPHGLLLGNFPPLLHLFVLSVTGPAHPPSALPVVIAASPSSDLDTPIFGLVPSLFSLSVPLRLELGEDLFGLVEYPLGGRSAGIAFGGFDEPLDGAAAIVVSIYERSKGVIRGARGSMTGCTHFMQK